MKTPIPAIEKVIAERADSSEENINIRLFWAYKHSLEAGNDLINFYDIIWEHDIEGITTQLGVVESGSKPILFGDFSYFWIAERGKRNIKRLSEKYADEGMIGYITFQRVDARLVDPEAVKILEIK